MTKRRKMYADKCRDRGRRKIQAAMEDILSHATTKRYMRYDDMIDDRLRAWYVPKKVSLFDRLLDRLFK